MHLYDGKPGDADNNVQPPLLGTGVLESPHAIAVHIPEGAGGRVHAALAGIAERAVRSGGLVDHALLDDCAVHGETEGRGLGGFGRCGGVDQGLEDSVLGELVGSVMEDLGLG